MIDRFAIYVLTEKRFSYITLLGVIVAIVLAVAFALVFLGAIDQNLNQYSGPR